MTEADRIRSHHRYVTGGLLVRLDDIRHSIMRQHESISGHDVLAPELELLVNAVERIDECKKLIRAAAYPES